MRRVHDLLKRYRILTPPHDTTRKTACRVLERVSGVHISPKQVTYSNRVLRLADVNPSARSAILVDKEYILSELEKELGKQVRDIR